MLIFLAMLLVGGIVLLWADTRLRRVVTVTALRLIRVLAAPAVTVGLAAAVAVAGVQPAAGGAGPRRSAPLSASRSLMTFLAETPAAAARPPDVRAGTSVALGRSLVLPDATQQAATAAAAALTLPTTELIDAAQAGTALALLGTLQVKPAVSSKGYDRSEYGRPWADVNSNGCTTRDDVLRRDVNRATIRRAWSGCPTVVSGRLSDPYTGKTMRYRRGDRRIDVDHVVALYNSWVSGAQEWTATKRRRFSNDPLELITTTGAANHAKGGRSAAKWLPAHQDFRCSYVARQISLKAKYGLWVTKAERHMMIKVLRGCATTEAPHHPRFDTCKQARAYGFGPYRKGRDRQYSWYRDRDSDGWVC